MFTNSQSKDEVIILPIDNITKMLAVREFENKSHPGTVSSSGCPYLLLFIINSALTLLIRSRPSRLCKWHWALWHNLWAVGGESAICGWSKPTNGFAYYGAWYAFGSGCDLLFAY